MNNSAPRQQLALALPRKVSPESLGRVSLFRRIGSIVNSALSVFYLDASVLGRHVHICNRDLKCVAANENSPMTCDHGTKAPVDS